jgi:transcriptional regulator with XRE-family HTH domain
VGTLTEAAAEGMRGWRARRRLTQADLGRALGLAARTVTDIEAARRPLTLDELPVVCAALGVTLVQLLDGADEATLRQLGLR